MASKHDSTRYARFQKYTMTLILVIFELMTIVGILFVIQSLAYWIISLGFVFLYCAVLFFTQEKVNKEFCTESLLFIDWWNTSIFIFDLDGTLTVNDEIPEKIETDLKDIYELQKNNVIIINSGSHLKRMMEKLSFFANFVKEEGRVFVQAEQGLITVDYFTKQEIKNPLWENAITDPKIIEKITNLFVNYNELVPFNGQNLDNEDELVSDVEGNKLILSKEVKEKTLYPIGYIGFDKERMKVIELFRDKNRKVSDWCKSKHDEAIKKIKKIAKENKINIIPIKCSTSIDLVPIVKKIPYGKDQGIGFILSHLSKIKKIPVKKLVYISLVFGDGITDFGMQFPKIGKKKLGKIDMIFCGDEDNYKYGIDITKVEGTSTIKKDMQNAEFTSFCLRTFVPFLKRRKIT